MIQKTKISVRRGVSGTKTKHAHAHRTRARLLHSHCAHRSVHTHTHDAHPRTQTYKNIHVYKYTRDSRRSISDCEESQRERERGGIPGEERPAEKEERGELKRTRVTAFHTSRTKRGRLMRARPLVPYEPGFRSVLLLGPRTFGISSAPIHPPAIKREPRSPSRCSRVLRIPASFLPPRELSSPLSLTRRSSAVPTKSSLATEEAAPPVLHTPDRVSFTISLLL